MVCQCVFTHKWMEVIVEIVFNDYCICSRHSRAAKSISIPKIDWSGQCHIDCVCIVIDGQFNSVLVNDGSNTMINICINDDWL